MELFRGNKKHLRLWLVFTALWYVVVGGVDNRENLEIAARIAEGGGRLTLHPNSVSCVGCLERERQKDFENLIKNSFKYGFPLMVLFGVHLLFWIEDGKNKKDS